MHGSSTEPSRAQQSQLVNDPSAIHRVRRSCQTLQRPAPLSLTMGLGPRVCPRSSLKDETLLRPLAQLQPS